ncbi:anti-sigma-factor antagonist [Peribacillus simplex]|uniref:Anti-sigma-factor antagonist n=1 Tax=Peribacillus simplex TaxID=1478 RepID=A0AAN2PF07_9BACI|nr:anti-sigma-factor antagonist [Peribacillus simplex]
MAVLGSYNREEDSIPYQAASTFCRLIIKNEGDAMHTANF